MRDLRRKGVSFFQTTIMFGEKQEGCTCNFLLFLLLFRQILSEKPRPSAMPLNSKIFLLQNENC